MARRSSMHGGVFLVIPLATLALTASAPAQKSAAADGPPADTASKSTVGAGSELDDLDVVLKAAVLAGVLDEKSAWSIRGRLLKAMASTDGPRWTDDAPPKAGSSSKADVLRLAPPPPGTVVELFMPRWQRRDARRLDDAFDFDADQSAVVEVLLEDAVRAHEIAAAPLREALDSWRRSAYRRSLAAALDETDDELLAVADRLRAFDRDAARERVRATIDAWNEDEASADTKQAWSDRLVAASGELEARFAAIGDRNRARLEDIAGAGAEPDAGLLPELAGGLMADQQEISAGFEAMLEVILEPSQRGREDAALRRVLAAVKVERARASVRLGGELPAFAAALAQIRDDRAPDAPARRELDTRWAECVLVHGDLAAARVAASRAREVAGLELLRIRAAVGADADASPEAVERGERRYRRALDRELDARVAVRDAGWASLATMTDGVDAGIGADLRDAVLRSGFPLEMRTRWGDRALARAVEMVRSDTYADETRSLLDAFAASIEPRIRGERDLLVEARRRRDPVVARDFIVRLFGDDPWGVESDAWRPPDHGSLAAIDDLVEATLRELLTAGDFARLPERVRPDAKAVAGGKGAAGKGVGAGKGAAGKGVGAGKGAAQSKPPAARPAGKN